VSAPAGMRAMTNIQADIIKAAAIGIIIIKSILLNKYLQDL